MSSLCRRHRWTLPPVCLLLTLATALPALVGGATTVVRLDDHELVGHAALIVTGECLDTTPGRLDGRLVTLATVRVDSVLKGGSTGVAVGGDVTVVLPGGVDLSAAVPVAEVWPGAPDLAPSQHALLFLRPFRPLPGSWSIVGYSQGLYRLTPAAAGGALRASRDLGGVTLLDADGETPSAAGGDDDRRGDTLAYWRRLVGRLAGGGEER